MEQIPSPRPVNHTAAIGTRYNLYESSSVRVFLPELPLRKVQEFLDDGTITHSAESGLSNGYLAHLTEVSGRGLAVNDGYTIFEEVGISAVARDYRAAAVGCITVSAPRSRTGADRIATLSQQAHATAQSASARHGYRSGRP